MNWNFRLVDMSEENMGEPYMELKEVFYNAKGEPTGYCEPCIGSETLEGMRQTIKWYALALDKPVLKQTDFDGERDGGDYDA